MTNTFAFGEWLTSAPSDVPFPYNGLSWTVCTLVAFYLVFPLLLPPLQKLSSRSLSALLVFLFHAQCWPVVLYLIPPYGNMRYYWFAAANPLARFPVFLMGVVAGLLRIRGETDFNLSCSSPYPLARYSYSFSSPLSGESFVTPCSASCMISVPGRCGGRRIKSGRCLTTRKNRIKGHGTFPLFSWFILLL